MENITIPANFTSLLSDFTKDLSVTFPEYVHLWNDMVYPVLPDDLLESVFEHCKKVYPERFFDILYQNDDIFTPKSEVNVDFLPNVDFKLLYNTDDLSDNTKKTIWKYLQLMLFTVVGEVKDKDTFGDTMSMFDGIDSAELQTKLSETMSGLNDFFKKTDTSSDGVKSDENTEEFKNVFDKMEGMPDMDNIQDHLKTLFNGKIGSLAKEMAEEISGEFADLIGEDAGNAENPQDIIKALMQNPKKIMDLMKSVGGKLDTKMKNGEISREEIMKEAGNLVNQMKDMGGNDELNNMFKTMAKGMGGLGGLVSAMGGGGGGGLSGLAAAMGGGGGGMDGIASALGGMGGLSGLAAAMGGMGGLGKNTRLDTNAMDRMAKKEKLKDNAKRRVEVKRLQEHAEMLKREEQQRSYAEMQQQLAAKYSLQQGTEQDKYVFRLEGEGAQEKSFIHPDLLREMEEDDKKKAEQGNLPPKQKKKKKSKK